LIDNMRKVYYAHPYVTRTTKGELDIIRISREKGYRIMNPFDGEDSILEEHGVKEYYGNVKRAVAKSFFDRDLELLRSCDSILGWVPKGIGQPVGTNMELMYAWMKEKYVIIISEIPSPFFICIADEFYRTISDYESATEWVIE